MPERQDSQTRRTPSPYRFLKELAQPIPKNFDALVKDIGRYEDRGQESIVCDSGDGFVNKLRPMKPSILTGYLAPLANIVYHKGDWKTCSLCREMAEPEMVAWYGTNEYNWEKMPDPPKFEPTKCHKCGKVINVPHAANWRG